MGCSGPRTGAGATAEDFSLFARILRLSETGIQPVEDAVWLQSLLGPLSPAIRSAAVQRHGAAAGGSYPPANVDGPPIRS